MRRQPAIPVDTPWRTPDLSVAAIIRLWDEVEFHQDEQRRYRDMVEAQHLQQLGPLYEAFLARMLSRT